jgi:prepilin-type processing-associated H-X9-DG protein
MPATDAPEPTGNGANGACILDIGYGVNSATQSDGQPTETVNGQTITCAGQPMQGITITPNVNPQPHTYFPTQKMTNFIYSSNTVLLYDGTEYNPYNATNTAHMWRISGARHGNWHSTGSTTGNNDIAYQSGTCNVLFLDGHAEGVNRADLPSLAAAGTSPVTATGVQQIYGPASQMLNNRFYWNSWQEH